MADRYRRMFRLESPELAECDSCDAETQIHALKKRFGFLEGVVKGEAAETWQATTRGCRCP